MTEEWSATELAQENQLNDWSTAGEQGKLVLVVLTKPSLAQFIALFTTGKNRLSIVQNYRSIQLFHIKISVKKKVEKKLVLTSKNFCPNFNPIRRLRVARKLV